MPLDSASVIVLARDEELRLVQRSLADDRIKVLSAVTVEEALRAPATVFLCDADASDSWAAMLERIHQVRPAARVVLLSRSADHGMWIDALCKGAYDMLPKPCLPREVRSVVLGALAARPYCAVA